MEEITNDTGFEGELFNLSVMNEGFSMDELDNWTTLVGLVKSVVTFIEKHIPSFKVHLFYHTSEFREYREIDREGITSFTDDSVFIGCLSMVTGVIELKKVFSEYNIDDPMIKEVLNGLYRGHYIVPIVHGFDMIAYLLLCDEEGQEPASLTDDNVDFLLRLSARLRVNLYAASIATKKQRELLDLAKFPSQLKKYETLQLLYERLLQELMTQIPFDYGVAYTFDEDQGKLLPYSTYGLNINVPNLKPGMGISGQVFQNWTSIFIPDRKTHPAYSLIEDEAFIDGSFISIPMGTENDKMGVITLVRNKSCKESFSLEHQYKMEIAVAFAASEITSRKLIKKLEDSNYNVVQSLSQALDAKDKYTEGHSKRVAIYSEVIAKRLGFSGERLKALRYAAILHDIGKIGVTDVIINKPGKLDDEEFKQIQEHTEIGYRILSVNPFFKDIKEYVRYHHEALDGSGYSGKKGHEIPEEAMIISCADIYDALTSDRPYRKALEKEQAMKILKINIGIHYTKEIFDAFAEYIDNGGDFIKA